MFICEVTTTKVNFRFDKQRSQDAASLICEWVIFAQNASIVFTSNIPLHTEKNPLEKLCKVLEMELKTSTSVGPKSFFEKIKFNVLHYLQHDFIRQCSGHSKDEANMFKSLIIHSILWSWLKGDKYFSVLKAGAANIFFT